MAERKIAGAVGLNGNVYRAGDEEALEAAAKEAGIASNPAWYGEGEGEAGAEAGGEATVSTGGGLDGLDFASDEAAEAASELGLDATAFEGLEPSGAGGYTKADVTKAAARRGGE